MPGIVGIIGTGDHKKKTLELQQMVKSMQHESFYSSGTNINESLGVYVGWTCHKGSYCDCMPIINESKDILLFFYGEHFIDKEEIDGLRARGHTIDKLDARIILHLYEEQGNDFLKYLNGWFHGLLIDLKKREVAIFNDRYGMQRLYYHVDGDSLLFAAEAKAILSIRNELRTLDPRGVGEYLTSGCVLENRSLFKAINTLPGGTIWKFRHSKLERQERYFRPKEWEDQRIIDTNEFIEQLESMFPRIMERYIHSRLPVGVSLSGGLDTRQIMAFINNSRFKIPCYTFDGMYRESHDARLARQIARKCGQNHQVLKLNKDFLSSFQKYSERTIYLSDGCLSSCDAYELYLNKLARQIAPVRLTGSYGSEVFRGMRGFHAVPPHEELIHPDFHHYIQNAITTYDEIAMSHNLSFSVFKQAPLYGYGRVSVEQSQVIVRTPFMDNDLVRLLYQAPHSARSTTQFQWRLIERGNPALVTIPTDRGLRGRSGPLASRWAYLTSYFFFKADYLYKSGMPQWMEQIHYVLGPLTPEKLVIGRHRFYHFRRWFRNELATYLEDILLDPVSVQRPYVNRKFIEPMVRHHIKGDRNYTYEIEKVLNMELIYRQFIDR